MLQLTKTFVEEPYMSVMVRCPQPFSFLHYIQRICCTVLYQYLNHRAVFCHLNNFFIRIDRYYSMIHSCKASHQKHLQ